jgi:hypothetical protein
MAIPSSSSASTSTAVTHASSVPPYISLQEVIEPQEGVTGLIITDHNGLLITSKGDLCEDTSAASRRAAGHFVQAVKTASTLSDSGAEHVTVTIDCAPAESTTEPTTGKRKARQIVLTKTSDFYLAVSSAEKN